MSSQQLIAHYRITTKLGEGGMGAVFRATDTKLNRDVAIKILPDSFAADPDRLARFQREAQVLASLSHPNIAAIYGVEGVAIVMELVEGEALRGPLPLDTALDYAGQIAAGLAAAHEKGIVHRDLKPANIKVTRDGTVKLLDFGLAKASLAKASEGAAPPSGSSPTMSPTLSLAMTQAGVILGTAAYMSPEQARGKDVDRRADVWAFGVVLYEMLTGANLFAGDTITDTLASVVKEQPDLTRVPPQVRRLLRASLVKDPKQRLQAIGDWRLLLDDDAVFVAPAPPLAARRFPIAWAALAVISTLVALALAFVHFREPPPAAEVVRFQLNPPPLTSFSSTAPNSGVALSPDGKYLAFVTVQSKGTSIWVQSLDSLTARELPETENAGSPFWSPDSRSIGFFSPGKLKRIEISGGPPVTLCDMQATGVGGTWNRDGVILFGTHNGPIFRTSAAGAAATPFTKLEAARKEVFHARPWFLPDGTHFLYTARGAESGIFVGSLEGGVPKRLATALESSAYVPPAPGASHGYLFYLREGALMAQPLDPKTYGMLGDRFVVAEKIGMAITNAFFTASANGTLAYFSSATAGGEQGQWFDREGRQVGSVGPAGEWNELDLSRDGEKVVAARVDSGNGSKDLWLMDAAQGVPTRFTFSGARNPVWSPDGKTIVFASLRPGEDSYVNLYTKEASGEGTARVLLNTKQNQTPWDWSDDGKYLIYGVYQIPSGPQDLWVLPMEGDRKPEPFLTSPHDKRSARFSPSVPGAPRWVAYASMESGRYEVYVESYPPGGGKFQVSDSGSQPRWRADGKELFYLAPDGKIMAVDVKLAPQFEHGLPKPLFTATPYGGGVAGFSVYAPSADGKRFLISTQLQQTGAAPVTVVLNWAKGVSR